MYEAIVTFVKTDTYAACPVTEVYRLEFDTEAAFRAWKAAADVVAMQKLTGETVGEKLSRGDYS